MELENEDRPLVEAAQRDPARFAELYERHFERVYAFIVRRVRDRSAAEDLTSEVFHQGLANIRKFEWRGALFGAWLIRIASNSIADRWQRLARERGTALPEPVAPPAAGDFFQSVPEGGDAYMLKHVIHDWDDAQATNILKVVRRAMKPEAKLLIIEGVYPLHAHESPASRSAAANDVNMMVCAGGRQRSEAEFRTLYAAAGFTLSRLVPTQSMALVIEGVPA